MDEIQRTIISRSLLEEYGYEPDQVSDELLETIANELVEYWGVSGGFRDALESTMSNLEIEKKGE